MSEGKIAKRYALALLEEGDNQKSSEQIAADMAVVVSLCNESKELLSLLKNPVVNPKLKNKALNEVFGGLSKLSLGLINVVTQRHREAFLPAIAEAYLQLYNEKRGVVTVQVTSATELESDSLASIESLIKKHTGAASVSIRTHINKEIIGGLVIKYGDYLMDSSITTQIRKLKKELNIV